MKEIELNIYDIEETHPNCTVQILKNSVTGEKSVGWKDNTSFVCFRCGAKLTWESDCTFEDYDVEGDGFVSSYLCPNCGAWYEVGIPQEEPKQLLDVDKFVSDIKEKYC